MVTKKSCKARQKYKRRNRQKLYPVLYPLIKEKALKIATEIYGASGVEYSNEAEKSLAQIEKLGLENLYVCMAKTQYSFSDNPGLLGAPTDFHITVREIEISAGAGFIVLTTGNIMRMPGLPSLPSSEAIDIDEDGNISGLF